MRKKIPKDLYFFATIVLRRLKIITSFFSSLRFYPGVKRGGSRGGLNLCLCLAIDFWFPYSFFEPGILLGIIFSSPSIFSSYFGARLGCWCTSFLSALVEFPWNLQWPFCWSNSPTLSLSQTVLWILGVPLCMCAVLLKTQLSPSTSYWSPVEQLYNFETAVGQDWRKNATRLEGKPKPVGQIDRYAPGKKWRKESGERKAEKLFLKALWRVWGIKHGEECHTKRKATIERVTNVIDAYAEMMNFYTFDW